MGWQAQQHKWSNQCSLGAPLSVEWLVCTVTQMAAIGVAVANGGAPAKAAADVALEVSNDEDAVAQAIERFVLAPRGLSLQSQL